jgi:hypothetical protein
MYGPLEIEGVVALVGLGKLDEAERLDSYWRPRLEAAGELGALVVVAEAYVVAASVHGDPAALQKALEGLRVAAERAGCESLINHAARVAQAHAHKLQNSVRLELGLQDDGEFKTSFEHVRHPRVRLQKVMAALRESTGARSAHLSLPYSEITNIVSEGGELSDETRRVLSSHGELTSEPRPAGSAQAAAWRRELEAHGFAAELLPLADNQVGVVLLEAPRASRASYDDLLAELRRCALLLSDRISPP